MARLFKFLKANEIAAWLWFGAFLTTTLGFGAGYWTAQNVVKAPIVIEACRVDGGGQTTTTTP